MKLRSKILIVIGGVFFCLLIFEIILRVGGMLFLLKQDYKNNTSLNDKKVIRIMCLGESTTAVGGDYAWPSQLEVILNSRIKEQKFQVFNKGIPGANTSMILENLPANLKKYTPDIVCLMIGINDEGVFYNKKLSFLNKLRFYNYVKGLIWYFSERILEKKECKTQDSCLELANQFAMRGNYQKADIFFEKVLKFKNINVESYIKYAFYLMMFKNNYDKAEDLLNKASMFNSKSLDVYNKLAFLKFLKQEFEEAEKILLKAKEFFNGNNMALEHDTLMLLGEIQMLLKKELEAKENFELAAKIFPKNQRTHYELGWLKNKKISKNINFIKDNVFRGELTKNNYLEIIKLLHEKGIAIFCIQYPVRKLKNLKNILNSQSYVNFIDNEMLFKQAIEKDGYWTYFIDAFAGDFGHCTVLGNKLLANNVADAIFNYLQK